MVCDAGREARESMNKLQQRWSRPEIAVQRLAWLPMCFAVAWCLASSKCANRIAFDLSPHPLEPLLIRVLLLMTVVSALILLGMIACSGFKRWGALICGYPILITLTYGWPVELLLRASGGEGMR